VGQISAAAAEDEARPFQRNESRADFDQHTEDLELNQRLAGGRVPLPQTLNIEP
jgi:hypothetical protein